MTSTDTSTPTVWVVRAGQGGRYSGHFEEHGLATVGFQPIGDVRGLDRDGIRAEADRLIPDNSPSANAGVAGMLYRFANEIRPGDIVVTPDSETRELLLGEVTGDYRYMDPAPFADFNHALPVRWTARRSRDLLPRRILYSLGSTLSVFKPVGQAEIRALLAGEPVVDSTTEPDTDGEEVGDDLFLDVQSRADELVKSLIAALDGYETQDLVAGILKAMGYFTSVAAEGADGGVDVVASKDPLAVEPPIIKVQVKARPSTRTPPNEVRALAGILTEGESGLFVSTGGFTSAAEAEAVARRITLIDMARLQELLIEYYDRLPQDAQALIPLRRVYLPS